VRISGKIMKPNGRIIKPDERGFIIS